MTPLHAAAEMYLTDPKRAFAILCNHIQEMQKNTYGEWQVCPKCLGQKVVSRPPYIPVDADTWGSTAVTHQCDICHGLGILKKPLIICTEDEDQEISFVKGLEGPDSNLLNPDNQPIESPSASCVDLLVRVRDETDII